MSETVRKLRAALVKVVVGFHEEYSFDPDTGDEWVYDTLGSSLSGAYFAARDALKATDP